MEALRLRALGCPCVAVGSVADAIDALSRERFDAVIAGGLELLAYMHHRQVDTPCVLMGTRVEDDVRRTALALGAVAVYDTSDLVDAFRLAA